MVIDGYKETTKFLTFPSDEEIEEGLEALLEGVYYNNGMFDNDSGIQAQIDRNKKEWLSYSSWALPPDIGNRIVYFVTDDYFQHDGEMSYEEREKLAIEFYKQTAQAVKFSINEIK